MTTTLSTVIRPVVYNFSGTSFNVYVLDGKPYTDRISLETLGGKRPKYIGQTERKWVTENKHNFAYTKVFQGNMPYQTCLIPIELGLELASRWKSSRLTECLEGIQKEYQSNQPSERGQAAVKKTIEMNDSEPVVQPAQEPVEATVSTERESAIIWLTRQLLEAREQLAARPDSSQELESLRTAMREAQDETSRYANLNAELEARVKTLSDELDYKALEVEELTKELQQVKMANQRLLTFSAKEQESLALSGYWAS